MDDFEDFQSAYYDGDDLTVPIHFLVLDSEGNLIEDENTSEDFFRGLF